MNYWNISATIFVFMVILAFPVGLHGDGQYTISADEGGVLFQTENDGEWYIPEEDHQYFTAGQSGRYRTGHDDNGRYLETNQGKFYLGYQNEGLQLEDIEAFENLENQGKSGSTATKVTFIGQHVIVPVQIKHKGRSLDLSLLLDTGASIIIIHKSAVKRLHFAKQQRAHLTTAGGHILDADLVELQEVRFGPYRQKAILAGIVEHKDGNFDMYDGLLGMNALKDLHYKIDHENSMIHWAREK